MRHVGGFFRRSMQNRKFPHRIFFGICKILLMHIPMLNCTWEYAMNVNAIKRKIFNPPSRLEKFNLGTVRLHEYKESHIQINEMNNVYKIKISSSFIALCNPILLYEKLSNTLSIIFLISFTNLPCGLPLTHLSILSGTIQVLLSSFLLVTWSAHCHVITSLHTFL